METRGDLHPPQAEADIARERKLLQQRVIYQCDRFGISQDRIWNLDETAVRIVPTGERGWTKRAEAAHVFASRAFVTVTLAANMRGGEERPSTPSWTSVPLKARVPLPDALDHAGRSLGHDRRDRRGHARAPW